MADKTCPDCGHELRQHSRNGCLDKGMCDRGCKKTFVELSKELRERG